MWLWVGFQGKIRFFEVQCRIRNLLCFLANVVFGIGAREWQMARGWVAWFATYVDLVSTFDANRWVDRPEWDLQNHQETHSLQERIFQGWTHCLSEIPRKTAGTSKPRGTSLESSSISESSLLSPNSSGGASRICVKNNYVCFVFLFKKSGTFRGALGFLFEIGLTKKCSHKIIDCTGRYLTKLQIFHVFSKKSYRVLPFLSPIPFSLEGGILLFEDGNLFGSQCLRK